MNCQTIDEIRAGVISIGLQNMTFYGAKVNILIEMLIDALGGWFGFLLTRDGQIDAENALRIAKAVDLSPYLVVSLLTKMCNLIHKCNK